MHVRQEALADSLHPVIAPMNYDCVECKGYRPREEFRIGLTHHAWNLEARSDIVPRISAVSFNRTSVIARSKSSGNVGGLGTSSALETISCGYIHKSRLCLMDTRRCTYSGTKAVSNRERINGHSRSPPRLIVGSFPNSGQPFDGCAGVAFWGPSKGPGGPGVAEILVRSFWPQISADNWQASKGRDVRIPEWEQRGTWRERFDTRCGAFNSAIRFSIQAKPPQAESKLSPTWTEKTRDTGKRSTDKAVRPTSGTARYLDKMIIACFFESKCLAHALPHLREENLHESNVGHPMKRQGVGGGAKSPGSRCIEMVGTRIKSRWDSRSQAEEIGAMRPE
ncbi:hypothetical protein DFH06DRAFT_1143193 [Mycena polygramma]|nr:hypothetical protein DFH06DRAFT_1143193 [Mycena polygramma]